MLDPYLEQLTLLLFPLTGLRRRTKSTLNDHLRNAMATKSLASNEALLLQAGESVERGGNEKEDSRSDKAGGLEDKR